MIPLANEILLLCLEHLDIDSFLAFRLTCRKHRDLIDSHMTALAEAVAISTFPGQTRIFRYGLMPDQTSSSDRLRWLKSLRCYQLAAIQLECTADNQPTCEDPLGDVRRAENAEGWKALAHLSMIAKEVQHQGSDELCHMAASSTRVDADAISLSEPAIEQDLEICRRRCQYVETLSLESLCGLRRIRNFIFKGVFGYSHDERPRPIWHTRPGSLEEDTSLWVWAQVLQDGPEVFWISWTRAQADANSDPLFLKHKYEGKWQSKNDSRMQSIKDAMTLLHEAIERTFKRKGAEQRKADPDREASHQRYVKQEKQRRMEAGDPGPPPIFADVPIRQHISFEVFGEAAYLEEDERKKVSRETPSERTFRHLIPSLEEYKQLQRELHRRRVERRPGEWKGISVPCWQCPAEYAAFPQPPWNPQRPPKHY